MNNAEYVKSLGLEFKDLTVKFEDYSETDKVYTWGVLNKKTNKSIGSTGSIGKRWDISVIIGEWLLRDRPYVDEEDQSNKNEDSKALLRYKLNKITREFVNDTSISGKFLCKNQYAYFNNLQSYVDRVNKLFGGKDLCDTFHAPFLNEERKEIYIVYDSKRYVLGSVCGEAREVCYDKIYEFVEKYPHPANNYSMASQLLYSLLETSCGRFNENFYFRNYKNSINILQDMARDVSEIIEPAECKFVLEYGYYDLNIYYKDKKYVLAYCNEDKTNFHKVESNIEEFVYDFLEDTTND